MFARWVRESTVASIILVIIRLWLGNTFMAAGFLKLTQGYDATEFFKNAIANPVKGSEGEVLYGWYVTFLKAFALPNVDILNAIVPLAEFAIGLGLIFGCLTTAAAFFGLVMNFSYLLAGTISNNALDIFFGMILLFAGYNAGRYGLDYWIIPFVREAVSGKTENADHKAG